MNATFKIFLRNDYKNKNGKSPVYLLFTINRNKKVLRHSYFYTLKLFVEKTTFCC
jgi:hypothetical protein